MNPDLSLQPRRKTSRARKIIGILGIVLIVGASFWIRESLLSSEIVKTDFVGYWAAGRLLGQHQNPYDHAAVLQLERSLHPPVQTQFINLSPPWALSVTVPLGWFDVSATGLLWLIALIASALSAAHLTAPPRARPISLLAIFFAPVFFCLGAEQMTLFVLLGLALFVHFQERRPFAAGLALSLILLKPHLLPVFLVVAALEIGRRRQIRVVAGFLTGFAAMGLTVLGFDHEIWRQYLIAMGIEKVQNLILPNLPNIFRLLIGPGLVWPLFIPVAAALPWGVWYWWRNRAGWDWSVRLPIVAAVSVLVAPYSLPYDQVLFWPAILAAWPRASRPARAMLVAWNVAAMAVTLRARNVDEIPYIWTAPALMLWCMYAWWHENAAERNYQMIEVPAPQA